MIFRMNSEQCWEYLTSKKEVIHIWTLIRFQGQHLNSRVWFAVQTRSSEAVISINLDTLWCNVRICVALSDSERPWLKSCWKKRDSWGARRSRLLLWFFSRLCNMYATPSKPITEDLAPLQPISMATPPPHTHTPPCREHPTWLYAGVIRTEKSESPEWACRSHIAETSLNASLPPPHTSTPYCTPHPWPAVLWEWLTNRVELPLEEKACEKNG